MDGAEAVDDPRFKRLAAYLAARAPDGKLPGRQHIDPADIRDLLPCISLVDVVPQAAGEPRYRVRLAGTDVVALLGVDGTGKFVDEILTTGGGAEIIRAYQEILYTKRPQYLRGFLRADGRDHVPFWRAAFPLARNGEDVDMILFLFVRPSG